MRTPRALLLALAVASVALAGCLGGAKEAVQPTTVLKPREITQEAEQRFEELTAAVPVNYTFPGQLALEPAVVWLNGTIDTAANTALEGNSDEGGLYLNQEPVLQDFSSYLPARQAAEIHIKLFYFGNPGQSADLDICVQAPGADNRCYDPGQSQDMNWNIVVKRTVVNTVGVEGMPLMIGVQASNGKVSPSDPLEFFMEIAFHYPQDVLTPYHPYAFTLPEGATGVVLRSVKVTGDEHVQAEFVILSPADELVSHTLYDDIAIPTESVFIPLRQPGEYVFYAYSMVGGFLNLKADVPVPAREVRILPLALEEVVDYSGAAAPGVAEHDLLGDGSVVTPYAPGTTTAGFTLDRHPLRVEGFFTEGVAGDVEMRIIGPKGLVYKAQRTLHASTSTGTVGFSGDHWPFVVEDRSLLAPGAYAMELVVDGFTGTIGHRVLTYARGGA